MYQVLITHEVICKTKAEAAAIWAGSVGHDHNPIEIQVFDEYERLDDEDIQHYRQSMKQGNEWARKVLRESKKVSA